MRALIVALTLCALAGVAMAAPTRFKQDRFVISFFVEPPLDAHAAQYYGAIADAHFNVVMGTFAATTPELLHEQIGLCRREGLQLIANPLDIAPQDLPNSRTVWGFFLRDEPSANDFPGLRARVDALREHQPGKLAYINLFPSYCDAERLGTDTYDEHVRRFVEEVDPDVLCMDHYPHMTPELDTRDAYCADLATMRKHSLARDIPFWNFFNIMPFGPHKDPTEAQVRWQAFTSVAHGAKGVLYFCYWTPPGAGFEKGGAIIGRDGRPTHHYAHAQRLNTVLRAWGPTLMQLTGRDATRLSGGPDFAAPEGYPLATLSEGEFDAGLLTHADGRAALVLVNRDTAYTAWPTIAFAGEAVEVDRVTGEEHAPVDASPDLDGLQCVFEPGDARLFLIAP